MIRNRRNGKEQVCRTSEPYYLSPTVIRIVALLFPKSASSGDPQFASEAEDLKHAFETAHRRSGLSNTRMSSATAPEEGELVAAESGKEATVVSDSLVAQPSTTSRSTLQGSIH